MRAAEITPGAASGLDSLRIAAVWRDLGGPPIRRGRSRAWWRDGQSMAVSINAARNVWHDFVSGEGGGILRLVEVARNCTKAEAVAWLEAHSYIEPRNLSPEQRRAFARRRAAAEAAAGALSADVASYFHALTGDLGHLLAHLKRCLWWAHREEAEGFADALGVVVQRNTRLLTLIEAASAEDRTRAYLAARAAAPGETARLVARGRAHRARCREWTGAVIDVLAASVEEEVTVQ